MWAVNSWILFPLNAVYIAPSSYKRKWQSLALLFGQTRHILQASLFLSMFEEIPVSAVQRKSTSCNKLSA